MKITLMDYYVHRNETTFRPLLLCADELADLGIKLTNVFDSSADVVLVGQASITNKEYPLELSAGMGQVYLRKLNRPYIIWDGQDSTSLKGVADVIRLVGDDPNYLGTIKNSLLKNLLNYTKPLTSGRFYWGESEQDGYAVPDIIDISNKLRLSGTNWLSTILPNQQRVRNVKQYDVNIVFSHEDVPNFEYRMNHGNYYSQYRVRLIDVVERLAIKHKLKVAVKPFNTKVLHKYYYQLMAESRILFAPFGYGELAPRDVESAIMGCVLFKSEEFNEVYTEPSILNDGTCVFYNYDNLEQKLLTTLDALTSPNYESPLPENLWRRHTILSNRQRTAERIYNSISDLLGV